MRCVQYELCCLSNRRLCATEPEDCQDAHKQTGTLDELSYAEPDTWEKVLCKYETRTIP